jgi:CheY-like chemotaxis protein
MRMAGPDESRAPGHADTRAVDVLVVDDSEIMCELAARMLRGFGCRVTVAYGGKQAMELLSTQDFDIVLMDCQMPDVDGFDVVRVFRLAEKSRGDGRHVPIVAVTGETAEECKARCHEAGMDDYLGKPFTSAALRRTVERHVRLPASKSAP